MPHGSELLCTTVGLLAGLTLSMDAQAHPLDIGYLDVAIDGTQIDLQLDLSIKILLDVAQLPESTYSPETVPRQAAALARATLESAALEADGAPCAWSGEQATLDGPRVKMHARVTCPAPPAKVHWTLPFLEQAPLSARIFGKVTVGGADSGSFLLEPGRETVALEVNTRRSFAQWVSAGIHGVQLGPAGAALPLGTLAALLLILGLSLGAERLGRVAAGYALGAMSGAGIQLAMRHPLPSVSGMIAIGLALMMVGTENLLVAPAAKRGRLAVGLGAILGAAVALGATPAGGESVLLAWLGLASGLLLTAIVGFGAVALGRLGASRLPSVMPAVRRVAGGAIALVGVAALLPLLGKI